MGRRIFDNIKKAVAYIFAVHVPIAGLSMVPVFFADWPLLLLPIHVVFPRTDHRSGLFRWSFKRKMQNPTP